MGRINTWAEFVPLARRTIHYNVEGSYIYRQILLRAEIGEFLNGIHKRMISKEVSDEYLMLELGDICWALAQIDNSVVYDPALWRDFDDFDMALVRCEGSVEYAVGCGIHMLTDRVVDNSHSYESVATVIDIIHWTFIGGEVTSESLQQAENLFIEILNKNIEKLEERYGL